MMITEITTIITPTAHPSQSTPDMQPLLYVHSSSIAFVSVLTFLGFISSGLKKKYYKNTSFVKYPQSQAALEFDSPLEDFSGQSSSTSSDILRHNPPWFRPTGSWSPRRSGFGCSWNRWARWTLTIFVFMFEIHLLNISNPENIWAFVFHL